MLVLPVFEAATPATAAAAGGLAGSTVVLESRGGAAAAGQGKREAGSDPLPRTKERLRQLDIAGGLRPFHCGVFPQQTPSVNYDAWWALGGGSDGMSTDHGGQGSEGLDSLLDANWHDNFEPVGVAAARQLPPWSEAFRGYGLNKVQMGTHLNSLGFRFKVGYGRSFRLGCAEGRLNRSSGLCFD
jgi:hypothetical protein